MIPGLLCDERLWSSQTQTLANIARSETPSLTACESIEAMAEALLPASHAIYMRVSEETWKRPLSAVFDAIQLRYQ